MLAVVPNAPKSRPRRPTFLAGRNVCAIKMCLRCYLVSSTSIYPRRARRRSFRPRFILNREPIRQNQPVLIRTAKIAAIVVGTYIAGAFMLGGRERLRVRGCSPVVVCYTGVTLASSCTYLRSRQVRLLG